ncbi:MAG: GNAT family N-acetyltransferase [Actinomycetota bacterium]|nr:GNAT family N-acetyltransferase [Actinomycetota bacterium]
MLRITNWQTADDTAAVQEFVAGSWPAADHPGGKGWEWAIRQLPTEAVIVRGDHAVAGWAGVSDGHLTIQAPRDEPAARALLDWALEHSAGLDLDIAILDGDTALNPLLDEAGFAPPGDERLSGMFHPAGLQPSVLPPLVLPPAYLIRPVRPGEERERIEVHRRAWKPVDLPWPGDDATLVDPVAESSFLAEHFDRLKRTTLYSTARDLVVEAPDGSLAACCTMWWHPALKTSQIEPLGVVPEHRRKGLATAMCRHVEAATAALGGTEVFIDTWHLDDYPAAAATYLRAGYERRERGVIRRRASALPTPGTA